MEGEGTYAFSFVLLNESDNVCTALYVMIYPFIQYYHFIDILL